MRHLIDSPDLTTAEVDVIINRALDIINNKAMYAEACHGKKLATLFYEPSTRTRLSFTAAMMELGGNVLGFSDANSSSVSKGETVEDTVRVVGCFAYIISMLHHIECAPLDATMVSRVPIINAGIKGVLNFTSVPMNFPQGIVVENYDITTLLEKVAYFVKEREENEL